MDPTDGGMHFSKFSLDSVGRLRMANWRVWRANYPVINYSVDNLESRHEKPGETVSTQGDD
jgi:hypothetical protein